MGRLIYTSITSLDGYIADRYGHFDWSAPSEEVHAFVNELERATGTHLYGRRLYEVLVAWETLDLTGQSAATRDFAAIWRAAEKIVYSRTLLAPSSARTRIEPDFFPDAVRAMKAASERDLAIGGADLAGQALRVGLVDEVHQFLSPVIVGGGTHFLPAGVSLTLELVDERRFTNGVVHLHYRTSA